MKGKSVSFLISNLHGGGAERVCATLANKLSDRGWAVTIIVVQPFNREKAYNLNSSVQIVSLNATRSRYAIFKFLRVMHSLKPSQIILFNYEVLALWFFSRLICFWKGYVVFRNVNTLSKMRELASKSVFGRLRFWLVEKAVLSCDHIVAQCQVMKDDLLSSIPNIAAERITVIYNPVAELVGDKTVVKLNRTNKPVVLGIGRLENQKRFDITIDAFAQILDGFPRAELWLAGKGSLEDQMKKQVAELGIQNSVKFLGYVEDTARLYQSADCLMLTSDYEGFPNVVVEALAVGLPVVSVDCPSGPAELILQDINGYLVPKNDMRGLVNSLASCLAKEWEHAAIIESVAHLAPKKIAEQYELVLNGI